MNYESIKYVMPKLERIAREDGASGVDELLAPLSEPGETAKEEQREREPAVDRHQVEFQEETLIPPLEAPEFVAKTLVGTNAETKRLVELSIEDIEEITGIPKEDMFCLEPVEGYRDGTALHRNQPIIEAAGKKYYAAGDVAYVGALWQARKIFDSPRLFLVEYEYGEIATFSKSFQDAIIRLDEVAFYPAYNPPLKIEKEELNDEGIAPPLTEWEKQNMGRLVEQAYSIYDILKELAESGSDPDTAREQTAREKIQPLAQSMLSTLETRKGTQADLVKEREAVHRALREARDRAAFDPLRIEWFFGHLATVARVGEQCFRDVADYRNVVKPKLEKFLEEYKQMESPPVSLDLYLKQKELSILNNLRLQKKTEHTHPTVSIFPETPFQTESLDRLVQSYSVTSHAIADADSDDFKVWWAETARVLKPGGRAYYFPMQQGFPFGRVYDDRALTATLDEWSTEQEGPLKIEWYTNPDHTAWRQDETLILTKTRPLTPEERRSLGLPL